MKTLLVSILFISSAYGGDLFKDKIGKKEMIKFWDTCGDSLPYLTIFDSRSKGKYDGILSSCDKILSVRVKKKEKVVKSIFRPLIVDLNELGKDLKSNETVELHIEDKNGVQETVVIDLKNDTKSEVIFYDAYQMNSMGVSSSKKSSFDINKECNNKKYVNCFYGFDWGTSAKYILPIIRKWYPKAKLKEKSFSYEFSPEDFSRNIQINTLKEKIHVLEVNSKKTGEIITFAFLSYKNSFFLVGGKYLKKLNTYVEEDKFFNKVKEKYSFAECKDWKCTVDSKQNYYIYLQDKKKGSYTIETLIFSRNKTAWQPFKDDKDNKKIKSKRKNILKKIKNKGAVDDII